MPDLESAGPPSSSFAFEKHAQAISAVAAVTSAAASLLMIDYRTFGYILAGTSILLLALVSLLRNTDHFSKRLKWCLILILAIAVSSVGLLPWSYVQRRNEIKKQLQAQPVTSPTLDSHNSYKITTTGKNSPVITGGSGPISIGDQLQEPPKKKRK